MNENEKSVCIEYDYYTGKLINPEHSITVSSSINRKT